MKLHYQREFHFNYLLVKFNLMKCLLLVAFNFRKHFINLVLSHWYPHQFFKQEILLVWLDLILIFPWFHLYFLDFFYHQILPNIKYFTYNASYITSSSSYIFLFSLAIFFSSSIYSLIFFLLPKRVFLVFFTLGTFLILMVTWNKYFTIFMVFRVF